MAGIKAPILDILTRLREITDLQHIRIWNNQLTYEVSGELYNYPKPAAFVEVINDVQYQQLGDGYQGADVGWRIHIVHEFYDAQDGTFEQDLPVFDLRDKVVAKLALYKPVACGPLTRVAEQQDYEHNNLYHYVIDFVCHFIDSLGSPEDPLYGTRIQKPAPTTLEMVITETMINNTPDGLVGT